MKTVKYTLIGLTVLCCFFLMGCNNTQQTAVKLAVGVAMNHGLAEYNTALSECDDPNNCPRAEKIKDWMMYGATLQDILDEPIPDETIDRIVMISDLIIKSMEEDGGYNEYVLYIRDIQTLLKAMKE